MSQHVRIWLKLGVFSLVWAAGAYYAVLHRVDEVFLEIPCWSAWSVLMVLTRIRIMIDRRLYVRLSVAFYGSVATLLLYEWLTIIVYRASAGNALWFACAMGVLASVTLLLVLVDAEFVATQALLHNEDNKADSQTEN